MIYRDKIMAALTSRRADFLHFENDRRAQLAAYAEALDQLTTTSSEALLARLSGADAPGALPTPELDRALVVPFAHQWPSREEARAWSYGTLLGRTTFAADGSQILPTKDFSVPVAAVQIGWFENPHTPDGRYVKDAAFELLAPAEVIESIGSATEISESLVQQRRFVLEVRKLREYMMGAAARGIDPTKPPVVFFDNQMVVSFAELLPEEQRNVYVQEIIALLDDSNRTGIPVVGYIDTSIARDFVNMLKALSNGLDAQKLYDALLFAPHMKWGDRTALFHCARRGILDSYGERWKRNVGFVYLKTSSDGPPSRLDIPMWVYERGLLDYVIDTVRGEVIVGNGYPYCIEAADQTAVLSTRDREMFYALFQEFAERESLSLRIAHKAISKAHRR